MDHLNNEFKSFYTAKIEALISAVRNATNNHQSTKLNDVITASQDLVEAFDPTKTNNFETSVSAEAGFIKAPVYNTYYTASGNGSITLLGDVATLSQKLETVDFAAVSAKKSSSSFTDLSAASNTSNYQAVRQAYRDAVELGNDYRVFNARYLGDLPTTANLDASIVAIKRLDRDANRFDAFDDALTGTFAFDDFRNSFITTQDEVTGFTTNHPEYTSAIFDESRAGAQKDSLLHDRQEIAEPVAVNRIQYDLFHAALTQARTELDTLVNQLKFDYTVTRDYWWFRWTVTLDWTNDARYTQKVAPRQRFDLEGDAVRRLCRSGRDPAGSTRHSEERL